MPPTARSGDRAPAGALREAIIAALRLERHPILSRALKAKVMAAGYPSRINGQYWTITLRNLSEEGAVVKVPRGSYSTYRLKRH